MRYLTLMLLFAMSAALGADNYLCTDAYVATPDGCVVPRSERLEREAVDKQRTYSAPRSALWIYYNATPYRHRYPRSGWEYTIGADGTGQYIYRQY